MTNSTTSPDGISPAELSDTPNTGTPRSDQWLAELGVQDRIKEWVLDSLHSLPMLIGISGSMGSGKDTAAAFLVAQHGYGRVAFGDAVREESATAIRFGALPYEMPAALRLALADCGETEVHAKPTSSRVRSLLQWWGTEYRRAQDGAYWVKRAGRKVEPIRRYVFSDVRFANEAAWIRSLGGKIWKITGRASGESGFEGHVSEMLIDVAPDWVIDNSGSIEDLSREITVALNSRDIGESK